MKNLLRLLVLSMLMVFAVSSIANATITIREVELDGTVLSPESSNTKLALEKGDEVTVRVEFESDEELDDMRLSAEIESDDHDVIQDRTDTFKVQKNTTYVKRLTLPITQRMDQRMYTLELELSGPAGEEAREEFTFMIEAERHLLLIRDVIINPESQVDAGRALLVSVRVENRGQKDEKDVQVKVSIPSLGESATSFIDEIEKEDDDDDRKTSEEMFLRIPSDAATGVYTLRAEVTYDEGDETVVEEVDINVVGEVTATAEAASEERTVISLASDLEAASASSEIAFPVTLTNAGTSSKVYTVTVDGATWGTFRVSPSNVVVVDAGQSKAVNVYATPNADAAAGRQTFLVSVQSDGQVLKQIPLSVDVAASADSSSSSSMKKILEVGLIVLLILVVVIGLILGFTRRRDDDDNEEEQSYY